MRADRIVLLGVVSLRREASHVDGGGRKAVRVTHIAHISRGVVRYRKAIHRGGTGSAGERNRNGRILCREGGTQRVARADVVIELAEVFGMVGTRRRLRKHITRWRELVAARP